MNFNSTNKILAYTLVALVLIATYITFNSYYTQLAIYEEKEIFKLDCIANAVAYKISGDDHSSLVYSYPQSNYKDSVLSDDRYQAIYNQMYMAKVMTQVPSEMYTVVRAPSTEKFTIAISTEKKDWLSEEITMPSNNDSLFIKGGMIGRFEKDDGTYIGAVSPIRNSNNEVLGVLQVNESFESFLNKSKKQVLFNVALTLFFVFIIGALMFFSVKNILKRQSALAKEKQEIEKLRIELLTNVSHDLKTPLTGIQGYLETIHMKNDSMSDSERKDCLEHAITGTRKLQQLIQELFELAKLESKDKKLNLEKFDISELAFGAANQLRNLATGKGIEIETNLNQNLPKVEGDLALIDRVLQNLIGNSIKFCEQGDKIMVTTTLGNQAVEVTVEDTGCGMDEHELERVFDRFQKGNNPSSGSGIGLAIVKGALDLHKSQYNMTSKPGVGTTFKFTLPIA